MDSRSTFTQAPSPQDESHHIQRQRKRELYRQRLLSIDNEDDPLAIYDDFVKWTQQNYDDSEPDSGLLELLEEATRKFKDDNNYKTDLRYLKLWSLYAHQVNDPAIIYAFLLAHDIGTNYSALYEEYADVLENDGKFAQAEDIYRTGIQRKPRAVGRLKSRYNDFKNRIASSSSVPVTSTGRPVTKSGKLSQENELSRNPLVNHEKASSSPSAALPKLPSGSRYAVMLAPPAPGKRPEKLRFNLSLLFTEEGKEYSIQEARARSMGLLGKKWPQIQPEPSQHRKQSSASLTRLQQSSFKVDHNTTTARRRAAIMGEPTVTINTKEALADVFGMYNSPEKTKIINAPGSKHAPLKKVDPITPVVRQAPTENGPAKTPTPATFRPYVDVVDRKENNTPGLPQFKPFVDPQLQNATPFSAPESRRALAVKDPGSLPRTTTEIASENVKPTPTPKTISEENNNIFRQVFTPLIGKPPLRRILEDKPSAPQDLLSPPPNQQTLLPLNNATAPSVFKPFADAVFTRPSNQNENAYPSHTRALSTGSGIGPIPSKPLATENRLPLPLSTPFTSGAPNDQEDEEHPLDDDQLEEYLPPSSADLDGVEDEDLNPHRDAPLGGRFGQFNVMTPITERTFEFTTSTRGSVFNTPGDTSHSSRRPIGYRDEQAAAEDAERLAAELRREDMDQGYAQHQDDFDDINSSFTSAEYEESSQDRANELSDEKSEELVRCIEEKTGNLSLIDAMTLSSKFKPPNPCNPFDPPIVMTLLNLMPSDAEYHDCKDREAKLLEGLQRFAKRARKSNGDGNNTGVLPPSLGLTLGARRYNVLQKLGEGGFGAVFQAQDISSKGDSDDEAEADEDEDGPPMVAIKVVKPRNIWEYHVLRRLRSSVLPHIRRSIVTPHALYAFRDESFLVLDFCAQGTLLDVVNNASAAGVSQQGACLDELLVMFFSIELLRLLEGIHAAGFIHGDLKIDNCLLRLEDVPGGASAWSSLYQPSGEGGWSYKGLKVIDFGRTVDTRLFTAGQHFVAEWDVDERDCLEMREGRPWTFQPDYFGLAGIIYCMLFGKYIQSASITTAEGERYRLVTPFKRYWQSDLWGRLFDLLLNPCLIRSNSRLPLCEELNDIRKEMETWLQNNCNRSSNTLKGLLKKVEVSVWRGSTR